MSVPPVPLPESIGAYRILGVLGEGGMGIVYEAEQQNPRRVVALKVVRGGRLVDADTIRMFLRETETLARLKHPAIASIYESGRTEDGCHFFAMELVRGATLGQWAAARGAIPAGRDDLRARLALFVRVCEAVQYAHQRGVIHRDIKPSNVLVLEGEAGKPPDVKILDFGLARITDSDVRSTTQTEIGVVRGTLPYISPEQLRGNPDEVDARADVYALGVVLYELVAGRLPYDLAGTPLHDVVRIICESPPAPLNRTLAGSRRLDSDLETIFLKALQKEPARRYSSAAALGEDIERYLANQPILARPPSAAYQVRKLVSRHRFAVAFASTVLVLIVGFAVAMGVLAGRVARERDRANREAESARRVAAFLSGVFTTSDPDVADGAKVSARELLDNGARGIDRELAGQPAIAAAFHGVIGEAYRALGLLAPADEHLGAAVRLRRTLGVPDRDCAGAILALGYLRATQNRFAEAEPLFAEGLALLEKAVGPTDEAVGVALNDWAGALILAQRPTDAMAPLERARAIHERPGGDPQALAKTLANLANAYQLTGRLDEGLAAGERALALQERALGPEHPLVADTLGTVAELHRMKGAFKEAEEQFARSNAIREKTVGPDHPRVALGLTQLANLYYMTGRAAEAEPLHRRALAIRERVFGAEHSETANSLNNLSVVIGRLERYPEAEALQRRALAIQEKLLGPENGEVAYSLNNLGSLLLRQNRLDEARPLLERALRVRTKIYGAESNEVAQTLNNMGNVAMRAKRYDEADAFYARALALREKLFGRDNPAVAAVLENLAKMRRVQGRAAEADALDARAKDIRAHAQSKP